MFYFLLLAGNSDESRVLLIGEGMQWNETVVSAGRRGSGVCSPRDGISADS